MDLSPEVQSLIAEEEQILAQVRTSLLDQIADGSVRLRIESNRARELNAEIVGSTRAEHRQMLASDEAVAYGLSKLKRVELGTIEKQLAQPYFARVVIEEHRGQAKPHRIEYRIGLSSNVDCRIVDWRKAPISRLYYEYKEGDEYSELIQGQEREGTIVLRNKVEIKDGELRRLSCRYGNFAKLHGVWQATSGDFKSRGSAEYGKLPSILSLITAEQFRAITEDATSAVLIQGVAGSGKTTVALHRLAWLLHENNSDLTSAQVLVLVRSNVLKRYIEESLSLIGLEAIKVLTYHEWTKDSLAGAAEVVSKPNSEGKSADSANEGGQVAPVIGATRVKRSLAILRSLEEYAQEQGKRLLAHLLTEIGAGRLPELLKRECERISSSNLIKPIASVSLIDRLSGLLKESRPDSNNTEALFAYSSAMDKLKQIRRRLTLYREDLLKVLENRTLLLQHDETHLLDHELIRDVHQETKRQFAADQVGADDQALIFRLHQLKIDPTLHPTKTGELLRHIIVDEVQDFSPVELATIVSSVKDLRGLTLAGDTAQEISSEATFPGWEKLRAHWGFSNSMSQLISLSVTHRSTLPIMQLAEHINRQNRKATGRPGRRPLWYLCHSENTGVQDAIHWLLRVLETNNGGIAAVLCRNGQEARHVASLLSPTFGAQVRVGSQEAFSFEEGIVVADVEAVKGIEFPAVLLWNPVQSNYPNTELSRRLLYVALTRAEEHLCIVTWGQHSPLLPSSNPKLLRYVDKRNDEEEADDSKDDRFYPKFS